MASTSKIEIPSLESASPAYAAATAKVGDLRARLNAANARYDEVTSSIILAQARDGNYDEAAARLLAGGEIGIDPGTTFENMSRERARLAREIGTLKQACTMAVRLAAEARGEASGIICAELRPQYQRLASALVDAVLAAEAAHAELHAFTAAMDRADIAWTGAMRPIGLNFFRLIAHNDALPVWFRDARLHRLTDRPEPERWKAARAGRVW